MFEKLQYISQGKDEKEQWDNIHAVLDAGCTWIQLRYKNHTPDEVLSLAAHIKPLCDRYKSVLILNDFPDIAKLVDAHGVHVGLNDVPVATARAILGDEKIIGGTANTLSDVRQRLQEKCSYIGLGPYRFTKTKENLSPVLGLEGYSSIFKQLHPGELTIPVYAIGGLLVEDIPGLSLTGIYGVALSGILTLGTHKTELITNLKELLYGHVTYSG